MIILLHTSKTMRTVKPVTIHPRTPQLLDTTSHLTGYVKSLSPDRLAKMMHISPLLAMKTKQMYVDWTVDPTRQSLAIDSFIGDIYSGLRADTLTAAERDYADKHLRILSGLYGILRPYDGVCPYRLEMEYKLPDYRYKNLYQIWGTLIASTLPASGMIVNLASAEYSRTVLPFIEPSRVVSPKFLTIDPKTNQAVFVVVHAKIARGAFARWLITTQIQTRDKLQEFHELGYTFDASKSTSEIPLFVCRTFEGKGLSMRLQK